MPARRKRCTGAFGSSISINVRKRCSGWLMAKLWST